MDLMKLLPKYYENNETMKLLQKILSDEFEKLDKFVIEEFIQVYPSLASVELTRWEKILNLSTLNSLSDEIRRERILSKLAGTRTTTKEMIKETAKVFTNGDVEIIEDIKNYHFTIKFVSIVGQPPDIDGFIKFINEIKPAHLAFSLEFKFVTHKDLEKHTHSKLRQYTHERIRNEVIS